MAKIVLDPGHGGTVKTGGSSPNNARGPSGLLEKTVTLQIALRAERVLTTRGHQVVLTRRSDVNLGLRDRAAAAKSIAAPVFLSIHLNGIDGVVQGTETICDNDHLSISASMCRAVQKKIVAATGYKDRNASHPGGVKTQPLGVLTRSAHHAKTACCLVEISFMDVPAEEARLKTGGYLDRISVALADGIEDYLSAAQIESEAAGAKAYGDGFEAEGNRAVRLTGDEAAVAESPALLDGLADNPDDMNDRREFADGGIGDADPAQWDTDAGLPELGAFQISDFEDFVASLQLRHFVAAELLQLGGSNAPGQSCAGKNSFPPQALWPNIANTARMLDEIRHRLGYALRISSAYRALSYNTCIGGESASLHMRFNAIDFQSASGKPSEWHAVAKAVRASSPRFTGGIGRYNTFVHIDTRGQVANW